MASRQFRTQAAADGSCSHELDKLLTKQQANNHVHTLGTDSNDTLKKKGGGGAAAIISERKLRHWRTLPERYRPGSILTWVKS